MIRFDSLFGGERARRLWLAETTIRALETASRCPDVAEVLHLWVREIAASSASEKAAAFLLEGGRWVRFLADDQSGEPPVFGEGALASALAAAEPLAVDPARGAEVSAVLARYSGRNSWRGVLALWSAQRDLSTKEAQWAHEIALGIGRSLTALRRAETGRGEAVAHERARLAADLHDGFLQSFLSAKLHVEACRTLGEERSVHLGAALQRTNDLLGATVGEMRRFLLELRLPPESIEDFVPWLRDYASDFARENGIPVDVRVHGEGALSKPQASEATRLVREALTNVRKHARARSVRILVAFGQDGTTIVVSDDGIGFDLRSTMERILESSHHGLVGMRYRAESVGGEMRLRTEPGKGTTLVFRLRHEKKRVEVERREAKPVAAAPLEGETGEPTGVPSVRDSLRATFSDLIATYVDEETTQDAGSEPGGERP